MNRFARACLAAAMFALTAPAIAALPQQGVWAIGNEADGSPGRGVQIDRQGNLTLIITYFGYRADGSATFMQSSGKLEDGKRFVGDLVEYKNGRALGGGRSKGEVEAVVGPIAVEFDTPTSGTITLPGEAPQRFARFQYEDNSRFINNAFSAVVYDDAWLTPTPVQVSITASGSQFSMVEKYKPSDSAAPNGARCEYTGDLTRNGGSFTSKGKVQCQGTPPGSMGAMVEDYRMTEFKVDEYGTMNARLYLSNVRRTVPGTPPWVVIRHYSGACISSGPVTGFTRRCTTTDFGFDYPFNVE